MPKTKIQPSNEKKPLIQEIKKNTSKTKIVSMSCADVAIFMKGKIPIAIHGKIFMDGKKFRMTASSMMGKELDIGVNENFLWYWSKRARPKTMYFTKLDNLKKSRLKSALNPEWITMSIMLDQTDLINDEKINHPNGIIVLQNRTNHMDENMTIATLIDRDSKLPKGRYLYSGSGKMVASSEVTSRQNIQGISLPKNLLITWYEEGIVMEWIFREVSVNPTINNSVWLMPDLKPAVDIGK